jgi:hypothetical protein
VNKPIANTYKVSQHHGCSTSSAITLDFSQSLLAAVHGAVARVKGTCSGRRISISAVFVPALMTSIFQAARNLVHKPLKPLGLPTAGHEIVNQNVLFEEEKFVDFKEGMYCFVNIGDVFAFRYQVVGSSDLA